MYPLVCRVLLFVSIILTVNGNHHKHKRQHNTRSNAYKRGTGLGTEDLPDLEILLRTGAPAGKKYKILGCELSVRVDGCKMILTPDERLCKDTLSLGTLTNVLMKSDKLREVAGKFVPFEVFQVEKLKLNKCKDTVEFETKAKEKFDIIKEKLELGKGKLTLRFNYRDMIRGIDFEKLAIEVQGDVKLGDKLVQLFMTKREGWQDGIISIKARENMKVVDFVSMFKKNLDDEISFIGADMFSKTVVRNPIISGFRDKVGAYELVVTGEVSGLLGLDGSRLFVIVQKQIEEPVVVGVIIDMKASPPEKAISVLIKKELNDIPLIKDYTADLTIEHATGDIMLVKDARLHKLLSKYITNGKTITQGLKIKAPIPMKKIIEKTGTKSDLKSIPDTIYLQIMFIDGVVCFKFSENSPMDLLTALAALTPKVPDFLFQKILKTPPLIVIKRFDVNLITDEIELQITAPRNVVLGDGLLDVENAEFVLKHRPKTSWEFEIDATKVIGGVTMDVAVTRVGDEYEFQGKINELTTRALVEYFGGAGNVATGKAKLNNEKGKQTALEGVRREDGVRKEDAAIFDKMKFLNFAIKDLTVGSTFGGKTKIQIKGKPAFFDWDASFEGFIVNQAAKERAIVFGIQLRNISLDDVIQKLFGKRIIQLAWMTDLTASLIISNTEKGDGVDFTIPTLKQAGELKKGVVFKTSLKIPEECKKEPLCEVIKDKMKSGVELHLEGEITSSGVNLRAPYTGNGIPFGDNMLLTNVALILAVSFENTEFSYEGEMKFVKQQLIFKARLGISPVGTVELGLMMNGIWTSPFGLQYITFSNIKASVGVSPGVPITKLEMSADLLFGKESGNSTEISAASTIGFSPANPLDNFFIAALNNVTLTTLSDSLDINVDLPDVLLNSTFPDGLIIGFSTNPKGKEIQAMNIQLNTGLALQGRINILGFQLQSKLVVNVPEKLELKADMSVVEIGGGLIKLRRSVNDKENGPSLTAVVSQSEVGVKLAAYAELLGIGGDVAIDISNDGILFNIYGNLFNLIEANMSVSAPYGNDIDIQDTDFFVSACLPSVLADVTAESKKTITDAADSLAGSVQETQETMNKAGSWYDRAMKKMEYWDKKMEEKQAAIDKKSAKLDALTDYLNSSCVNKCPEVCLGGFVKAKKCKKLFGKWVSCPQWDECKTKVDDPLCLAKCKAEKLRLHATGMDTRAAMEILSQSVETIQKVELAVHKFVNAAKEFTDLAEEASVKLEQASASGRRAIFAIANYSKEHLIEIHSICINTTLAEAQEACFGLTVNVTLGGAKNFQYEMKACLDVSFVKNFGKAVAEQLFPGISSIKDILASAKNYFKDANKKQEEMNTKASETDSIEREMEGKIQKLKQKEKSSDDEKSDAQKKDEEDIFSRRDRTYIRHQIYGDFPSIVLRDDVTMDSFNRRSPWAYSETESPFDVRHDVENETDSDESTDSNEKAKIPLEDLIKGVDVNTTTTNCTSTKHVVDTYKEISDSLTDLVTNAIEQEEKYHVRAKNYAKEMDGAEKDIIENAQHINLTEEQTSDSLFYMQKLKNGTSRWLQNVDKQLVSLDKDVLNEWRNSFIAILLEQNIDVTSFINTLMKESVATEKILTPQLLSKRRSVFGGSIILSTKIVNEILTGDDTSLSSRRQSIESLREQVNDMSTAESKISCVADNVL